MKYEFISASEPTYSDGREGWYVVGKARVNGRKMAAVISIAEELKEEKEFLPEMIERLTREEAEWLYRRDWWRFPFWDLRDWINERIFALKKRLWHYQSRK